MKSSKKDRGSWSQKSSKSKRFSASSILGGGIETEAEEFDSIVPLTNKSVTNRDNRFNFEEKVGSFYVNDKKGFLDETKIEEKVDSLSTNLEKASLQEIKEPSLEDHLVQFSETVTEEEENDAPILPTNSLDYDNDFGYVTNLPAGWTKYYDEKYDCDYYMNELTGESQWELPVSPAKGEKKKDSEIDSNSRAIPVSPSGSPAILTIKTIPSLVIDEGLESLKQFNEKNKKRAKSLSHVAIQWFDTEDQQDYLSGEYSPPAMGRDTSLLYDEIEDVSPSKYEYRGHCFIDRTASSNNHYNDGTFLSSGPSSHPLKGGRGGPKLNQDYNNLARLYKLQRPYSNPKYKALCVLCHKNYVKDVFFPCEHHCVCRKCIKTENICDERGLAKNPNGYCNCSLCAGIIKLILPLEGGKEVQKYWNWVYEEKVVLPPAFMKDFRHSSAVIKAVYLEEKEENGNTNTGSLNSTTTSTFCVIT
jgi:hypothetical protein